MLIDNEVLYSPRLFEVHAVLMPLPRYCDRPLRNSYIFSVNDRSLHMKRCTKSAASKRKRQRSDQRLPLLSMLRFAWAVAMMPRAMSFQATHRAHRATKNGPACILMKSPRIELVPIGRRGGSSCRFLSVSCLLRNVALVQIQPSNMYVRRTERLPHRFRVTETIFPPRTREI